MKPKKKTASYHDCLDQIADGETSILREPEAPYVLDRVREGLPMTEFRTARSLLDLSEERLAGLLGMSRATLHRRKTSGQLDRMESDRLVRYVRLFARACEALGGDAGARSWLASPAVAFHGESPLDFADTEVGAREVEAMLLRLEHGVFT